MEKEGAVVTREALASLGGIAKVVSRMFVANLRMNILVERAVVVSIAPMNLGAS